MITLQMLCVLLGGLVRSGVGSGIPINKYLTYLLTALFCGYVGLAPTLYPISLDNPDLFLWLWVSAIAALNLAAGYTRWECWWWQALRFGLPSLVLVLPYLVLSDHILSYCLYLFATALTGSIYPHRQKLFELLHLPERSFQIPFTKLFITLDSARLAEFILGAAVIGGTAWLGV
jgi:hypothetical protein